MELLIKIKTYFKDIYIPVGFTTGGIIWSMTNTMTWPTISYVNQSKAKILHSAMAVYLYHFFIHLTYIY